ncbi:hypothetical protein HUX53_30065 [Actinomadura sp. BRA 177]|nr:hypothetical protein [Actinomadura sp. BRA 177]
MAPTRTRPTTSRLNQITPHSHLRLNSYFCATDLNGHTGTLSADEGGAHIARQTTAPETGVFINENGGTYPW